MMGDKRPPGTSTAYDRLHDAFEAATAPFGVANLDRHHLADYLLAALRARLTWGQAETDIRAYLTAQGAAPDRIEEAVYLVRPLLQPWLS
jgi:hypothetical protein